MSTTALSSALPPQPLFFHLPIELRLAIYEACLPPTKARSLYLTRHIWAWNKPPRKRTYLNLLLVCRKFYTEVSDILYSRHELLLYTDRDWDLQSRDLVRFRLCGIEDYTAVFQHARKIRLALFVTGEAKQNNVLVALLAWLKAVLQERRWPLELLTLVFSSTPWNLKHKSTAVIYAAQALRDIGPAQFDFQCGFFPGPGTEDAMKALIQHANEKIRKPSKEMTKEDALKTLHKAWNKSRPRGYWPRLLSNYWLKAGLEM